MSADAPLPGPGAAPPAEGELASWLSRVRKGEPEAPPAPPPRPRRRLPAWLFLAALLLPGALLVWVWGQGTRPPPPSPVAVSGVVHDRSGQPLHGALVFAVARCRGAESAPRKLVRTDAQGRFLLDHVGPGRQTLVVVFRDIGQEFNVRVEADAPADVGTLVYLAPPEH
jgi:hypothetical protein